MAIRRRTGVVLRVEDESAVVRFEDGEVVSIRVPEEIDVREGMPVDLYDTGDGAPVVRWGV